jgi:hypothetical protein
MRWSGNSVKSGFRTGAEGTVRRAFDRYGDLTHDFLTSPEHTGPDSTPMEERGYGISLVMPEFDTLLTAEEVARNLKVSKDGSGINRRGYGIARKSSTVFRRCCSATMQRVCITSVGETSS